MPQWCRVAFVPFNKSLKVTEEVKYDERLRNDELRNLIKKEERMRNEESEEEYSYDSSYEFEKEESGEGINSYLFI